MNKLHTLEKNKILALVSLVSMVVLGFFVTNIEGGLFGEEKIYELMGGAYRTPIILSFSKFLAFIGSAKVLVPVIILAVVIGYYKKKKNLVVGLILSSLGVFILNSVTKLFFQRQRPIDFMLMEEVTTSYPSGHTMTNTCLYLFLAYYLSRYVYPNQKKLIYFIAILCSFLMGFSRVHLGVHYFSDIVGGFLGAYGFFIITVLAVEKANIDKKW